MCADVDECATGQDDCNTLMGKECVNTDGGFVCRCGSGLVPKGDNCEGEIIRPTCGHLNIRHLVQS